MNLEKRISAFASLGKVILDVLDNQTPSLLYKKLAESIVGCKNQNGWFTEENVRMALLANALWLNKQNLNAWLTPYTDKINQIQSSRKVGVIMAGNIPMVGFHDFLCVLISGHQIVAKLSDSDGLLLPAVSKLLCEIEPCFADFIHFEERFLKNPEAVIATGSNNSARYFEHYFSKYPHIIRKNRNSVAVLSGNETPEDFHKLGTDIFSYFGLGCRNVSKIFVPQNFHFNVLFENIESFNPIIHHHKYNNNYTYQKAILLVNKIFHYDNGFLILKEDTSLCSPISNINYEFYENEIDLNEKLNVSANDIQCVVSGMAQIKNSIPFGKSQQPEIWDYADGVDTMEFLVGL